MAEIKENPVLTIYAVYDHPLDYPEYYVVRKWIINSSVHKLVPDESLLIQSKDLEKIHDLLFSMNLMQVPSPLEQDPVIIESWIY